MTSVIGPQQKQQQKQLQQPSSSSSSSSSVSDVVQNNNCRLFLTNLLGEKVICTLSDGRTATGRLVCVDRLMNVVLADCTCFQQVVSSDYTDSTQPPQTRMVPRYLLQAMVPGTHLVSMKIDPSIYERVSIQTQTS